MAPSKWIGYGDSGASPPTIIGLVSREIGAIAALGGGGDLGISVEAEGGDVVILRSVPDMISVIRYGSEGVSCIFHCPKPFQKEDDEQEKKRYENRV